MKTVKTRVELGESLEKAVRRLYRAQTRTEDAARRLARGLLPREARLEAQRQTPRNAGNKRKKE